MAIRQESANQVWEAGCKGDSCAMMLAAIWLCEGSVYKRDLDRGMTMLKQLSEGGLLWAIELSAYIKAHFADLDIQNDFVMSSEAVNQLRKMADAGNMYAMAALGELFMRGKNVPANFQESKKYVKLASLQGCLWAHELRQAQIEIEYSPVGNYDYVFKQREDASRWMLTKEQMQVINNRKKHLLQLNALESIRALAGLEKVKEQMTTISQLVAFQKKRETLGLKNVSFPYHCVFGGATGTGKRTVAKLYSIMLLECELLENTNFVELHAGDFLDMDKAQVISLVNKKIDEARGGMLFIEEAHVFSKTRRTAVRMALDVLVRRMEEQPGRFIVVLSGLLDKTSRLVKENRDLSFLFHHILPFEHLTEKEAMGLFFKLLDKNDYVIEDDVRKMVSEMIHMENENHSLTAGRVHDILLNLAEKHASSFPYIENCHQKELTTITLADLNI